MTELLRIDANNYTDDMTVFEKNAVRAIIIRHGKLAVQESNSGYYKILGGGVDEGETYEDALAREVREESGLVIIPKSIKEIGSVTEIRQDLYDKTTKYICHSFFYFCDAKEKLTKTCLTESEIREGFSLSWVTYDEFIEKNQNIKDMPWVDRDTEFVKMLRDGKLSK